MPAVYIDDLTNKQTQSTPDCFARIVRFIRRDTRTYANKRPQTIINKGVEGIRHKASNLSNGEDLKSVLLDIGSDILSCTVNKSKGSPTGSFTLLLSAGDINYHHAINAGDHIFIWMKRNRAASAKKNPQGIIIDEKMMSNNKDSGLKFYGVITGVRKAFRVDATGKKLLLYQVTGKDVGFFFEASIYYNATALGVLSDSKVFEVTGFGSFGAPRTPDTMVKGILDVYLGSEVNKVHNQQVEGRAVSENVQMFVPPGVQNIFRSGKTIADMLVRRIGVEKYSKGTPSPDQPLTKMQGYKTFHVDVGAQYPVWAALQAYSNPTINEMFIDLKLDSSGKIFPTFTMRQIPFTSKKAASAFLGSKVPHLTFTTFNELPRLKIPEKFILGEDLGRGDHERFNFIELFGIYPGLEELTPVMTQMAQGNYAIDEASVKRYGLRPFITRTDYHFPDLASLDKALKDHKEIKGTMVPIWVNLLTDWYLGAHTLESGSISMVGIEEPISIGDNLEIVRQNGVNELYHIEGYSHNYTVDGDRGIKTFRTSVDVTRGQRIDEYPIYTSGSLNEDDVYDIGLTDTEYESTSRSESASTASGQGTTAISQIETPVTRKKPVGD